MTRMTESDLLRYLDAESSAARHFSQQSDQDRVNAVRAYLRKPYGTEQPGRSNVVASDVFDTVEGILPELVEVFVSSDKAVVFDPVSADDEEGAEQATRACNHVFHKQNNGFHVLYVAAKDALLLRTGAIKWYWDERRTPEWNTYKIASEDQLAQFLTANPDAEVVAKEDYEANQQELMQAQANGQLPPTLFVRIKTVKTRGTVRLCNIPPEELEVSRRHNSPLLDDCPYVCHKAERTLSDVRQMGYKVTIEDIKGAANDGNLEDEWRDQYDDSHRFQHDTTEDESMIRGWLREEYVLVDVDGDGIAERRKIVRLGHKVLENVEVSHVPIAAWSPYLLTHRFQGLSVADLAEDFQRIRTDIRRAQLDNLDLANNQETVVLSDQNGNVKANIDDILNRRPGGVIREYMQGAVRPYVERWQGIEAMPMLEALDRDRQARTGWNPVIEGLDADALNKTATQVSKEANRSQKRLKMMARIMAECLVAPTMRGIFKTLTDYCMEKLSFKLNGQFVAYDPQEWRDQYNMTVNVGIGTGDQMQQGAMLMQIAQAQFALMPTPMGYLVKPENVFAVQARLAENAGFKNPGEFFTDPKTVQPPQPMPDPKMQMEQMKLQADAQKFQAEKQMEAYRFQAEKQLEMQVEAGKQEMQARQRQLEIEQQAQLKALEAEFADRARLDQLAFEKWKAELDAEVKLTIANKPDSAVPALQAQLQALEEDQQAVPEMIRDESGAVVQVRRGRKLFTIERDPATQAVSGIVEAIQPVPTRRLAVQRDELGRLAGVAEAEGMEAQEA